MKLTVQKYLDDDELKELKRIIKKYKPTNQRDMLLLETALATGARAQELLNIKRDDLLKTSINIYGLKKGNDREVPIPKKLMKELKELMKESPDDRLFPISYPRLNQIWLEYRPVKKKYHSIRHTAAILLYKKCKDVRVVKYVLGHKNLSTTEIYQEYLYNQTELKKAMGVR